MLGRSRDVVELLRRQVATVVSARPTMGGAREVLYLSLEALVRCGGSVEAADFVLSHAVDGSSTKPPGQLVQDDHLGAARDLTTRRSAAWFGARLIEDDVVR